MVEVVAECGKNQINKESGLSVADCLDNAKALTLAAKQSNASTCKWQIHVFQDEQRKRSESRYEWIKRNEFLSPLLDFWIPLKQYHEELGINFLVTGMSKMACEKINPLVDRFKIGSADLTNLGMLKYIAETKKPIILSTGMSTMPEVMRALDILTSHGSKITLVHCVSIYPCPPSKLNLNTIKFFKKEFPNFKIGFSDHSLNTFVPSLAVAMGAEMIEKHFSLDRDAFGPDHKVSLLPKEFKQMVDMIRDTEQYLGTENKVLLEEETKFWENFRV